MSSQGFGSTVNVEDLIALLKTLLEETSPKGLGYGGKESDMVTSRVRDLSRSKISSMKKNPAPRSICDCCGWDGWWHLSYLTCGRYPNSEYHDVVICSECDDGATQDAEELDQEDWFSNALDSTLGDQHKFNRVTGDHFRKVAMADSIDGLF